MNLLTCMNQEQPTLDLANDCFQFVARFFEVISLSAPHIYQSALLICPKESIVRRLYGSQAKPMVRVIQGVPSSWGIASTRFSEEVYATAWSPCSRLLAAVIYGSTEVAILDAVTLGRLHSMNFPSEIDHLKFMKFSPDSHLLTGYSELRDHMISWDLQTGGLLSSISTEEWPECHEVSYSECGTMIGGLFNNTAVVTFNILSGTHISSHSIHQPPVETIWTHGKYLQFATIESGFISIWQVGFSSSRPPTMVSSLPTPDNLSSTAPVLLPTLLWLAFIYDGKVQVWDAQNRKVLLDSQDVENPRAMSFSSDGQFFVCGTFEREFHIWKSTSAGYLSHQRLVAQSAEIIPLISPDGGSVVASSEKIIQLWHTEKYPAPPTTPSMQACPDYASFSVDFSPDESLVAVTEKLSYKVTVLDTKSGNLWLVIDTDAKTYCLRITEDRIIVVCDGKFVIWDLPARGSIHNDRRNIRNSFQTTTYKYSSSAAYPYASISPNLNYVAIADERHPGASLSVFDMHTGEVLAVVKSDGYIPGFTLDDHEVWCTTDDGEVNQWTICEEEEPNGIELKPLAKNSKSPSSFSWHSTCGYQVTDDGWILCSSRKWLLWLPTHLRPDKVVEKQWSGKFLAIWNVSSLEPSILELEV